MILKDVEAKDNRLLVFNLVIDQNKLITELPEENEIEIGRYYLVHLSLKKTKAIIHKYSAKIKSILVEHGGYTLIKFKLSEKWFSLIFTVSSINCYK